MRPKNQSWRKLKPLGKLFDKRQKKLTLMSVNTVLRITNRRSQACLSQKKLTLSPRRQKLTKAELNQRLRSKMLRNRKHHQKSLVKKVQKMLLWKKKTQPNHNKKQRKARSTLNRNWMLWLRKHLKARRGWENQSTLKNKLPRKKKRRKKLL